MDSPSSTSSTSATSSSTAGDASTGAAAKPATSGNIGGNVSGNAGAAGTTVAVPSETHASVIALLREAMDALEKQIQYAAVSDAQKLVRKAHELISTL
jgi:hypothetical protein